MNVHRSHKTRFSDSSLYDEKCTWCGATDEMHYGQLNYRCPQSVVCGVCLGNGQLEGAENGGTWKCEACDGHGYVKR